MESVLRQPADDLVADDLGVLDDPAHIADQLIAGGGIIRLNLLELLEQPGFIKF